jgi:hypothetical protein
MNIQITKDKTTELPQKTHNHRMGPDGALKEVNSSASGFPIRNILTIGDPAIVFVFGHGNGKLTCLSNSVWSHETILFPITPNSKIKKLSNAMQKRCKKFCYRESEYRV